MEMQSTKDKEHVLELFDSNQPLSWEQASETNSGQQRQDSPDEVGLTFGHFSATEPASIRFFNDQAWKHLVKKSSMDPGLVMEKYFAAIRSVQEEVERVYAEKLPGIWSNNDFYMILIRDGCFFLQLALLFLGCHQELGYPPDHLIFGRNNINKGNTEWIEDLFAVGNQIPLVVLKKLMAQNFFKEIVLTKPKWTPTPSGFIEKSLYELLVLPVLKEVQNQRRSWICLTQRGNKVVDHQHASHLLHGLQIMLSGHLSDEYETDADVDLEENEYVHNMNSTNEDGTALIDHRATNLKQSRIYIKKVDSGGIRRIDFQKFWFASYLYLPTLLLDGHTEKILQNLMLYEKQRSRNRQQREVSSYIKFMSAIVRTKKDAKLLSDSKIIVGDSQDIEKLPGILRRLASSEDIVLTHQLQTVRRRIRNHSSTTTHFRRAVNVMVALTLIQTVLAVMAYLLLFLRFNVVS